MTDSFKAATTLARRAIAPVERFIAIESASSIVLLATTAIAFAAANSPLRGAFASLWRTPLALRVGHFTFERDTRFWISDGLMTLFFFVVGLEIRREIHDGELSDRKRAALPVAAALGGMIAPALIFGAFNLHRASMRGWGVPMATDIAFATAALSMLGKRVPPALRIMLLALAVIDDLGAILVIAMFYSKAFALGGVGIMAAGVALVLLLQRAKLQNAWAYAIPAIAIWLGALIAGIHPTLAGVIVAFITPIAHGKRLGSRLHRWVAFGVMPLFALANAGVTVGGVTLAGDGGRIGLGIVVGLLVGKPLGIAFCSWLSVRVGIAALPEGVTVAHTAVAGMAGGVGFTMALFVAHLAFGESADLETAKLAILFASAVAGGGTFLVGRGVLKKAPRA
jgi:NhaA family Na+:H+ antiporter